MCKAKTSGLIVPRQGHLANGGPVQDVTSYLATQNGSSETIPPTLYLSLCRSVEDQVFPHAQQEEIAYFQETLF